MQKILNKCPICGSKLELGSLYQYTKYFAINGKGEQTPKCIREDGSGPMDASFIQCVNGDFVTDCEFNVITPERCDLNIVHKKGAFYIEE